MLRYDQPKQLSFYSGLYEKIPETHFLKQVDRAVDFSFVNEIMEERYCKDLGRPAKEPEMMMKLLFLQYIYSLSDVQVMERASFDLVFLWFLGLNPEDKLPHPSLLAKFRTKRMQEVTLDEVIHDCRHHPHRSQLYEEGTGADHEASGEAYLQGVRDRRWTDP